MRLIETKSYLLLIDEKAKIKGTPCLCYNSIKNTWNGDVILCQGSMPEYHYKGFQKIVTYYPLTKGAKELDLPLLPNPFEDKNETSQEGFDEQLWENYRKPLNRSMSHLEREAFIKGYKAAQSKPFTLENVKKAIKMARSGSNGLVTLKNFLTPDYSEEEIIQSLSTQQLPKEFIPNKHSYHVCDKCNNLFGDRDGRCDVCRRPSIPIKKEYYETITNSEGKEELGGTYIY